MTQPENALDLCNEDLDVLRAMSMALRIRGTEIVDQSPHERNVIVHLERAISELVDYQTELTQK